MKALALPCPSNTVIGVYNDLIGPEHKVIRGSIGVQFRGDLPPAVQRVYGFKAGVLINAVTPHGPADQGGMNWATSLPPWMASLLRMVTLWCGYCRPETREYSPPGLRPCRSDGERQSDYRRSGEALRRTTCFPEWGEWAGKRTERLGRQAWHYRGGRA